MISLQLFFFHIIVFAFLDFCFLIFLFIETFSFHLMFTYYWIFLFWFLRNFLLLRQWIYLFWQYFHWLPAIKRIVYVFLRDVFWILQQFYLIQFRQPEFQWFLFLIHFLFFRLRWLVFQLRDWVPWFFLRHSSYIFQAWCCLLLFIGQPMPTALTPPDSSSSPIWTGLISHFPWISDSTYHSVSPTHPLPSYPISLSHSPVSLSVSPLSTSNGSLSLSPYSLNQSNSTYATTPTTHS